MRNYRIEPEIGSRVIADWPTARDENMGGHVVKTRPHMVWRDARRQNVLDFWEVLVHWDFIDHVGGRPSWEVWIRRVDDRRVVPAQG